MQTKDGTLVVEINQPDAVVQVFDEAGKESRSRSPAGKARYRSPSIPASIACKSRRTDSSSFRKGPVESGGRTEIKATLDQTEIKANPGVA